MQTAGIAVSNKAAAWDSPNSSMTDGRIGPTETIPGRKLIATRTIAVIASGPPTATLPP